MLRFEITPPKNRSDFLFLKVWAPSTCLAVSQATKTCDLEFAISKRSDLQFHSAIILQFFCGTCGESCDFEFAIRKRSGYDCDFWDIKHMNLHACTATHVSPNRSTLHARTSEEVCIHICLFGLSASLLSITTEIYTVGPLDRAGGLSPSATISIKETHHYGRRPQDNGDCRAMQHEMS